ncbi:hypothetical protein LPB140_01485 [Sphingorhabdus lutea]|uniref:Peptidase M20 dimerisation domain-containing protein n=2 Tax=Sphingorhabdus lutea TaxID=1913578 RepID=A0A1L3JED7_9SPHN|nr:hypothetical protein LPB140_01485 [Sphingorhabdus lutea]
MMAAILSALLFLSSPPLYAKSADNIFDYDQIIAELTTITEIAAPPFKEQKRAAYMAEQFRKIGLTDVKIDEEGNVTGIMSGKKKDEFMVVSAHLDTVFPEDTPIKVMRKDNRLYAPGIGDDSVGLTAILAYARQLKQQNIKTNRSILFVATVGEEGQGDLRGARYLMQRGEYKDRIKGFISIDGSDNNRITHIAVGSRRYRLIFKGPGGHSYGAFGIVAPMAAMGDFISRLYLIDTPGNPKTTYSASVVSGGTSVNTIADSIALEIDMRSSGPEELKQLEERVFKDLEGAILAENAARDTSLGKVSVEIILIGDRPAGSIPLTNGMIMAIGNSLSAHGYVPQYNASSTDSNIAIAMNIAAVTIGVGAGGGRAHSAEEYLNVEKEPLLKGFVAGYDSIIAAANAQY